MEQKRQYSVFQNLKYIIKNSLKIDKRVFIYFGVFTIISSIYPFINIIFPKYILDELMLSQNVRKLVVLLSVFFLSTSFLGFFISLLQGATYPRLVNIRLKFMGKLIDKCLETDYKNTEDPDFLNALDTSERAIENDDNGLEGILHKLFSLGGGLITLVGYIVMIGRLNIFILLYILISVSLTYYLTLKVKKYEHNREGEISEVERRTNYIYNLMYDFSYGKDLRIFGLREWIANLFEDFKAKRFGISRDVKMKQLKIGFIDCILLLIREGIVYVYLIIMVLDNRLSIGSFIMYFAAIASFASTMTLIMTDIAHINAQNLYINDLRTFLERKEESEALNPKKLPSGPYEIDFKNVSFKYPGSETYVYEDISFTIKAGQKLAIVGHNGAGKTTLIKLLCRMFEPDSGEILLNGINIKEFAKKDYFQLFQAVFQEIKTMAFSVAENVAATEDNIDRERVLESLQKADMKEKVLAQKKGIDTSMQKILDDDGVEFSGGETQRIILARALYKNGGIVILDEPTAALDALAEKNIYEKFNEMVQNKTSIFISHRLASTSFCDVIAMFEKGKLIEYGSHDELLELNGKYADMFRVQAQYYQENVEEELEDLCQKEIAI